jgi:hypothetical protein
MDSRTPTVNGPNAVRHARSPARLPGVRNRAVMRSPRSEVSSGNSPSSCAVSTDKMVAMCGRWWLNELTVEVQVRGGIEHMSVAYLHRAGIHATDYNCMRWRRASRPRPCCRTRTSPEQRSSLRLVFGERTKSGQGSSPVSSTTVRDLRLLMTTVSVCEPTKLPRAGTVSR